MTGICSQDTQGGPEIPWVMKFYATAHFPAERSSFITLELRDHPFDSLHSELLSPFNFP